MTKIAYQRVLIKLSGEALLGSSDYSIDPTVLGRLAKEIKELVDSNVQVALVVGGGNIFRGGRSEHGIDRVTGDHMGMLATIINALAMQDVLEQVGLYVRVMSAISVNQVCEDYIKRRAIRHLEKGRVVIFAAGTGNPFFTTDSAASLRAVEIGAQLLIKATKVNGVYTDDPETNPDATFCQQLTYDDILAKKLNVMDATAIVLCRDNKLPLRILNIHEHGALMRVMQGENVGSLVN